ncbi:MAG: hypothetical protein ACJZ5X_04415 [Opitutales bacterium]
MSMLIIPQAVKGHDYADGKHQHSEYTPKGHHHPEHTEEIHSHFVRPSTFPGSCKWGYLID